MTSRDRTIEDLALTRALAEIVEAERVLTSLEDRDEYAFDALPPARARQVLPGLTGLPEAIVRPGSVQEVQRIVRLANERSAPIVPYGGGTGVMGGAVPAQGGIVVDLRRLNRVLHVSVAGLIASVEAGILLGELDRALGQHGLMLGHDPWSQGIATVGGAISTNGVGYLAARCGTMGEQVLALQAVLPNGELLETRGVSAAAGVPLHSLFIGAEGALGVITAATLRLFPLPEVRSLHALAFNDFESGYGAILHMGRRGVRPSMIDYSQRPPSRGATLYLAFEGFKEDVEAQAREGLAACREQGAQDLGVDEAQRFWDARHSTAEAWLRRNARGRRFGRAQPWSGGQWFDYLNPSVPAERVLEYKARCEAVLAEAGLQAREYGIWGRPDLFTVVVISPEGRDVDSARAAEVSRRLLTLAQDMGGSMEYCHGVGLKLHRLMGREAGVGMGALRAIKGALDPNRIMNPGKLGL